jgi:hypothetical protein
MIIPPPSPQLQNRTGCVNSLWGDFFGRPGEACNDLIRHPQFKQVDTVALGGHSPSTTDQSLNRLAFVMDVRSVKELLPIEVEYKQPDRR